MVRWCLFTMPGNTDPHPDPVAQAIRNQQADAAAPSAAERARQQREFLADTGCQAADCDIDDPTQLSEERPVITWCANRQPPQPPFRTVLCDTHAKPLPERQLDALRDKAIQADAPAVRFSCGNTCLASAPEGHNPSEQMPTHSPSQRVPVTCPTQRHCDERLVAIAYPDGTVRRVDTS
jgi:hypothetical protein